MIAFVAFYMQLSQATMASVHRRMASITVIEPYRFIEAMFASAAYFHPGCRRVVLTDPHTPFPPLGDVEILRQDLDPTQPMLSRSTAWIEFIRRADSHIVFVDTDMLIQADLSHLFEQDFDVALTYRHQERWPINAGINFVHGNHLDRGYAFHQMWLNQFRQAHMDMAVWGGDQDALRDLLSAADFTRADSFLHRQYGFNILLIPCAAYNFSTEDDHGMTDHYPAQKVLHFKGRRKPNMLPYWERYLKPRMGA